MSLRQSNFNELKSDEKIFFPGLNALRFFAAFGVIITHIELIKNMFGIENKWEEPLFFNLGSLGVYFFFVLSGFLITFLLLSEKEKIGKIKVKQFYIRRILRIWPLYYLICILGFFVLPHFKSLNISFLQNEFNIHFKENLIMYILILPNLAFALFPAVPHIGQLWSIGVEEQFYLFWPLIINSSKNILRSLFVITIAIVAFKALVLLFSFFYGDYSWFRALKLFVAMSKIECMSIGGIGAYLLFVKNDRILKLILHRVVFLLAIISIVPLVYLTPQKLQDGIHIIFSIIFLIIILNVCSGKKMWFNLENKLLSFLGKISYGIYMYHLMIIPLVIVIFSKMQLQLTGVLNNILFYFAVTIATIIVASISYNLFEKKLIKLKGRHSVIRSGD